MVGRIVLLYTVAVLLIVAPIWHSHRIHQEAIATIKASHKSIELAKLTNAKLDAMAVKNAQRRPKPKATPSKPVKRLAVTVTAYDLSVQSCGKAKGHPQYGKTATGRDLRGHTLQSARAIAVDPRVIPLGTSVRLEFNDPEVKQFDGVYTACDTGGAIKGNRIDLYVGEDNKQLAYAIGRRQATVYIG